MKRNILRFLTVVLALCTFLCLPFSAFAVPNEEDREYLCYVDEGEELVLTIYFDKEMPDILLLGPEELRIPVETGRSDVKVAVYDKWALVQVVDPAPGSWDIAIDQKSNTQVTYNRMKQTHNLWIQYVTVAPDSGTYYQVKFLVERDGGEFYFDYTLSLAAADGSGSLQLKTGRAKTNEETVVNVDLSRYSSYTDYVIQLDVSAEDDGAMLWDEYSSDPFAFTNPNAPEALENVDLSVDVENHQVKLNWNDYKQYRFDSYVLEIYAEGTEEPIYVGEFEGQDEQFSMYIPQEYTKLTVNFYGRDGKLLSAPLTRDIYLGDQAYLEILTPAATASNQAQIKMNLPKDCQMDVILGEVTTPYISAGKENVVAVNILEGTNLLRAQAMVDDVLYYAERQIFKDGIPPMIILHEDYDGKTYQTNQVKIVGNAAGAAKLLLNDQELTVNAYGDFEATITLAPGENVAEFIAEDPLGNRANRTIYLYTPEAEQAIVNTNAPQQKQSPIMKFLPLIISGAVGIGLLIWILIMVKRRDKLKKFSGAALICIMVALLLAAGFGLYRSIRHMNALEEIANSMELSKMADESLTSATDLLEELEEAPDDVEMWTIITIIAAVLLVIAIGILIFLKVWKKKKSATQPRYTPIQNPAPFIPPQVTEQPQPYVAPPAPQTPVVEAPVTDAPTEAASPMDVPTEVVPSVDAPIAQPETPENPEDL